MSITSQEVNQILDGGERMYAPVEVAHILQLNTETVQKLCRAGKIKAVKQGTVWRISKAEVARYIKDGPRTDEEIKSNE